MSENQRPRESRVLSFGSGKIQESPVEVLYSRTQGVVHAYQEVLRVSCIRTRIRVGGEKAKHLLLYHGLYVRKKYPKKGEPGLHREDQRSGRTPKGALAGEAPRPTRQSTSSQNCSKWFQLCCKKLPTVSSTSYHKSQKKGGKKYLKIKEFVRSRESGRIKRETQKAFVNSLTEIPALRNSETNPGWRVPLAKYKDIHPIMMQFQPKTASHG